jgi:hypothetical protein
VGITASQKSGDLHNVAFGIWHLAEVQAALGRPRQAAETYRRAARVAGEGTGHGKPILPIAGMAYAGLSGLRCERNDLEAATRYAQMAIDLGRQSALQATAP